ncbi:sensor histidine kinase [Streptomyces sp. NPDC017202]|uniref:sensor histidine kinase n=1 Tax=Streptomyces sp. NPDC017202 TaxID=3364981 RepID=UPI00379C2EE7
MRGKQWVACRWQEHVRHKAERARDREAMREWRRTGEVPDHPGPPPSGYSLLPWLLLGMGAFSNLLQGEANPWIGGLGVLTFNSLYIYVVFRSFVREKRKALSTRLALVLMALVTCALALGYGGSWLSFFPLLGLAVGASTRGPWLGPVGVGLALAAGAAAVYRNGWSDAVNVAYGTLLSTMVTAAILSLAEAVRQLRAAREELARRAVEEERLRFSRDLHDLLGHTLSVIVVKSEAVRRLAERDLDAALAQVMDIEAVGRQALTEIREAVTGYREGSLATELDRARSVLTAAGVEPVVDRSGPPPSPRTAALLGWVVREAVTNVVRHSGAGRCEITVSGTAERARLTVTDDGTGAGGRGAGGSGTGGPGPDGPGTGAHSCAVGCGTGLTGLRERLAAAGGSLTAGPGPDGGFTVTAELPSDAPPAHGAAEPGDARRAHGAAGHAGAGQPCGAPDRGGARQPGGAGGAAGGPRPYRSGAGAASSPVEPVAGAVPSGPAGPTLKP